MAEESQKQQQTSTNDNPYIDTNLMDAYINFSPAENQKYLKQHGVSKKAAITSTTEINNISTIQTTINTSLFTNTSLLTNNQNIINYNNSSANSQVL